MRSAFSSSSGGVAPVGPTAADQAHQLKKKKVAKLGRDSNSPRYPSPAFHPISRVTGARPLRNTIDIRPSGSALLGGT